MRRLFGMFLMAPEGGGGGGGAPAAPAGGGAPSGGGGAPAGSSGAEPQGGQGAQTVGGPTADAQAQQTAAERRLKGKIKVNGAEREVEVPEAELWRRYQREEAWEDRMRKVADGEKTVAQRLAEIEQRERLMLEDPVAFLQQRAQSGEEIDPLEYLTTHMEKVLQKRSMDPQQRELEELREWKRQQEETERETEERHAREQQEAQEAAKMEKVGVTLLQASKKAGLPADDFTLEMMGKSYLDAVEALGEENVSIDDIVADTNEKIAAHMDALADKFDDEALLDRFPKMAARVHRAIVARYKRQNSGGAPAQPQQQQERPAQPQGGYRIVNSQEEAEAYHPGQRILRTL